MKKDYKELKAILHCYYRSPEWKSKRLEFHRSNKKICNCCGTKKSIECHHLSYEDVGNEKLEDLMWLCRGCHSAVHEFYESQGKSDLRKATNEYVNKKKHKRLESIKISNPLLLALERKGII